MMVQVDRRDRTGDNAEDQAADAEDRAADAEDPAADAEDPAAEDPAAESYTLARSSPPISRAASTITKAWNSPTPRMTAQEGSAELAATRPSKIRPVRMRFRVGRAPSLLGRFEWLRLVEVARV